MLLSPPGKPEKPLELVPLKLDQPKSVFIWPPAIDSPPRASIITDHSSSVGTCHPIGQRPRTSSTAYQLYNRPYSSSDHTSSHASPSGLLWLQKLLPSIAPIRHRMWCSANCCHSGPKDGIAILVVLVTEVFREPTLLADQHCDVIVTLVCERVSTLPRRFDNFFFAA